MEFLRPQNAPSLSPRNDSVLRTMKGYEFRVLSVVRCSSSYQGCCGDCSNWLMTGCSNNNKDFTPKFSRSFEVRKSCGGMEMNLCFSRFPAARVSVFETFVDFSKRSHAFENFLQRSEMCADGKGHASGSIGSFEFLSTFSGIPVVL